MPADGQAKRPGGRRDEILERFTELVADRGYDGTNFGDLAEKLGMSKGTIVHHFGTKERMLAEQHAQYLRRRLADAHLILESLHSPPEQLAGLIHLAVLIHRDDRAPTRAFARTVDRTRLTTEDRSIHLLGEEYTGIVRDVIRRGVDDGSFRSVDADLVALQIFGACNWAWTWFDPAGRCSAEEVAASFSDVSLAGLLASLPTDPELTAPGGRVSRAVHRAMAASRADGAGGVAADAGRARSGPEHGPGLVRGRRAGTHVHRRRPGRTTMETENEPHLGEDSGQEPYYGEKDDPESQPGGAGEAASGAATSETGGVDADDVSEQAGMRPTGSGGSAQPK